MRHYPATSAHPPAHHTFNSAVIIRSRVVHSDQRFFPNNDPLLLAMMEADDDGEDVHSASLGQVPDIRDAQAMRDAGYFQRVRQWAEMIVTEQANSLPR